MIEQKRVNKDASLRKIALNFSEKFGRSISPSGICRILHNTEEILKMAKADTELNTKKAKQVVSVTRAEFDSDLEKRLKEKYRKGRS